MWADRRTDMTKLIVAFRKFAKVPKQKNEKTFTLINAETPESTNITQRAGKKVNKNKIYRVATYVERKMCDHELIIGATGIVTKVVKKNLEAIRCKL
jgi:hypothetical protein